MSEVIDMFSYKRGKLSEDGVLSVRTVPSSSTSSPTPSATSTSSPMPSAPSDSSQDSTQSNIVDLPEKPKQPNFCYIDVCGSLVEDLLKKGKVSATLKVTVIGPVKRSTDESTFFACEIDSIDLKD